MLSLRAGTCISTSHVRMHVFSTSRLPGVHDLITLSFCFLCNHSLRYFQVFFALLITVSTDSVIENTVENTGSMSSSFSPVH